jgi:hypothetical protein
MDMAAFWRRRLLSSVSAGPLISTRGIDCGPLAGAAGAAAAVVGEDAALAAEPGLAAAALCARTPGLALSSKATQSRWGQVLRESAARAVRLRMRVTLKLQHGDVKHLWPGGALIAPIRPRQG